MSFKDKVVLITGGSSGIGAATAELFAKEGANVAIIGRNEERLAAVAENCGKYSGKILAIKADVTKDSEAKSAVEQTIDKFGKLDILVNNAGVTRQSRILDDSFMETYDSIMNINMRAVALLTSLAAPHLIKTKGNIVNISSVTGRYNNLPASSAYKVSKAALDHFTRSTAHELAPYGVRANAVSPGPVPTDIFNAGGLPDSSLEGLTKITLLGKAAETSEVADIIAFLASDRARSVTGSNYDIDNGLLLR